MVPAFVGLVAPYLDQRCGVHSLGFTRGTTKEHMIERR